MQPDVNQVRRRQVIDDAPGVILLAFKGFDRAPLHPLGPPRPEESRRLDRPPLAANLARGRPP
jgi:hypothetical protein